MRALEPLDWAPLIHGLLLPPVSFATPASVGGLQRCLPSTVVRQMQCKQRRHRSSFQASIIQRCRNVFYAIVRQMRCKQRRHRSPFQAASYACAARVLLSAACGTSEAQKAVIAYVEHQSHDGFASCSLYRLLGCVLNALHDQTAIMQPRMVQPIRTPSMTIGVTTQFQAQCLDIQTLLAAPSRSTASARDKTAARILHNRALCTCGSLLLIVGFSQYFWR